MLPIERGALPSLHHARPRQQEQLADVPACLHVGMRRAHARGGTSPDTDFSSPRRISRRAVRCAHEALGRRHMVAEDRIPILMLWGRLMMSMGREHEHRAYQQKRARSTQRCERPLKVVGPAR